MNEQNSGDMQKSCGMKGGCEGLMWWMTLLVAVLAVPAIAAIVAAALPFKGLGELIIFVLACWASTYLGMRLMKDPRWSKKIGEK